MRTRNTKIFLALTALIASVIFGGCASRPAYNRYSFDETARLKQESLAIVGKAGQSYPGRGTKADSLMSGVNSAYQDASLRDKNAESMRRWEILLDANQGSLAGILRQWKEQDTLSIAMIQQASIVIAGDFDRISKLENNKGR